MEIPGPASALPTGTEAEFWTKPSGLAGSRGDGGLEPLCAKWACCAGEQGVQAREHVHPVCLFGGQSHKRLGVECCLFACPGCSLPPHYGRVWAGLWIFHCHLDFRLMLVKLRPLSLPYQSRGGYRRWLGCSPGQLFSNWSAIHCGIKLKFSFLWFIALWELELWIGSPESLISYGLSSSLVCWMTSF